MNTEVEDALQSLLNLIYLVRETALRDVSTALVYLEHADGQVEKLTEHLAKTDGKA